MFGRSHYGWVECDVIDIETSIIFLLHKFHLNFQFCSKREKSNFEVNLYACDTRCVWVCSSCRECASNQHLTKINWKLQIFNRFPKLTSSKFFFLMAFVVHRFLPLFISVWLALFIMLIYIFIFFVSLQLWVITALCLWKLFFFLLWKILTNVFLMCDSHSWVLFW